MATYAIGDIQGCFTELVALLEKINFNEEQDKLWFVGDLVNRGSASAKVIRFIKSLKNNPIVVLGNHDLHLLAVAEECQKIRPQDTFQDVLDSPDKQELLDWLKKCKFLHHDEQLNYVLSHAGIPPQWNLEQAKEYAAELEELFLNNRYREFLPHMYGNFPDIWEDDLKGWDRYRFMINAFTRMRYCDVKGRLNLTEKGPVASISAELYPWYEVPNREKIEANIVFGHWAALKGNSNNRKIFAIDTGCAWGHELTALCLEDQKRFSVKFFGN